MPNNHIIKKITLNLDLEKQMNPGSVRSEVISVIDSKLRGKLSGIMDEICGEKEVLRIDKLELDLGKVNMNDLSDQLMKSIREQLEIENKKAKENLPKARQKSSTGERKLDALIVFLKTGSIPWWSDLRSRKDVEAYIEDILLRQEELQESVLKKIRDVILDNSTAKKRFISQFKPEDIQRFIASWYPQKNKKYGRNIQAISLVLNVLVKELSYTTEQTVFSVSLELFSRRKASFTFVEIVKVFIQEFSHNLKETKWNTSLKEKEVSSLIENKGLLKALEKIGISNAKELLLEIVGVLKKAEKNYSDNMSDAKAKSDRAVIDQKDKIISQEDLNLKSQKKLDPRAPKGEKKNKKPERANKPEQDEARTELLQSATFNYAGVVIIWPLITTLFDDRGLMTNKAGNENKKRKFKNEEAQLKALALLNYLSCGSEEMEEYDMPLNKVLCGLPVSFPVVKVLPLTSSDREECQNLLQHLINNWPILKSTTPNGLREGFIQREGELEENDDHWLLKVEKKTIDLLMDKMPWGYHTVKLPWMSKILIVEW